MFDRFTGRICHKWPVKWSTFISRADKSRRGFDKNSSAASNFPNVDLWIVDTTIEDLLLCSVHFAAAAIDRRLRFVGLIWSESVRDDLNVL